MPVDQQEEKSNQKKKKNKHFFPIWLSFLKNLDYSYYYSLIIHNFSIHTTKIFIFYNKKCVIDI